MSLTIGLTGQSGAGKTTACEVFAEAGFGIIDCDTLAHNVMEDPPCKQALVAAFSKEILLPDGKLDRRTLGRLAFGDSEKLSLLNATAHPFILAALQSILMEMNTLPVIVIDAPTLFESGADRFCDLIVSVVAGNDHILPRIMERDGIDESLAKSRLNCQHNSAYFRAHSDFVIENNDSPKNFFEQLAVVVKQIKERSDGR